MARRKDHTPEQLKALILSAATKLIEHKGSGGLTARALATEVGYTPGTIYNVYRDMDALITDINYETLGNLYSFCQTRLERATPDFSKIRALAYAYVDFSHANIRAWETLFNGSRTNTGPSRLPKAYQQRILSLFQLIEDVLVECLGLPVANAHRSARLLWACLHGITVLTIDGRLKMVGIEKPHKIIDDLLERYFSQHIKGLRHDKSQ
ncbi:MAG: TetR/AcrR family transcriptional regulator [Alphaproteobacteria bacterium]